MGRWAQSARRGGIREAIHAAAPDVGDADIEIDDVGPPSIWAHHLDDGLTPPEGAYLLAWQIQRLTAGVPVGVPKNGALKLTRFDLLEDFTMQTDGPDTGGGVRVSWTWLDRIGRPASPTAVTDVVPG